MFLKMLKSELKQNKGLNTVLLIFMVAASMLIFAGTVQIYSYFTGYMHTEEQTNSSEIKFIIDSRRSRIDSRRGVADKVFTGSENVTEYSRAEMILVPDVQIDFRNIDEAKNSAFLEKDHYITTMPERFDLVVDLNDKPFTVPNGCAALPVSLGSITGAEVGDTFRITTEMGDIYELTICGFFKDQLDWWTRYIVSDEDYAVLSADSHRVSDFYSLELRKEKPEDFEIWNIEDRLEAELKINNVYPRYSYLRNLSDESVMTMIISVFVFLISVFMILIILMTIRFTMIAALKEEEKEIGMMRAMGVDSLAFRWLFAAKYIGFALIGGAVGILLGVPVSHILFRLFSPNTVTPGFGTMMLWGSASVLAISVVMVFFSLGVMRRINKISVIDAIHGENRGERFGNSAVLFLFKRKRMPVPLYLAVSDILKRFKRYLFLLISYTLAISIMLIIVNLRNSVVSEEFMCYSSCYAQDFRIDFDDETLRETMIKRARSSGKSIFDLMNEDFAAAGIPAEVDVARYSRAYLLIEDYDIPYSVYFDGTHPERYTYRKGGRAPELENEVALSYYTASQYGLQVGDTITMQMLEKTDDNMTGTEREKQLVITGFIDAIENYGGESFAIMGEGYKDGYPSGRMALSMSIFTAEKDKPAVIERMKELYPGAVVLNGRENAKEYLAEYDRIFALLEYIMGGAGIFILLLMTYLYLNIFITEETREIALMKSMGFTDGSIRAWQMIRILILAAAAAVIAVIFVRTAGSLFIAKLFEHLELTGFRFLPEYLFSFGIIPAVALVSVSTTALLKLSGIGSINVSSINEE